MRAPLVIVAVVGSMVLAGCGSAGALDDAAVPGSSSASPSASASATESPSATASPSNATASPVVTASPGPSSSASPSASPTPSASSTAISTVLRTNTVDFKFGNGSWTGEFVWDGGYAVSTGQPWEGVTTSGMGTTSSVTILAGRHGTSEVAEWFRQRAAAAVVNIEFGDEWPSELNFAISGTLNANGSTFSIVIGQGNDGFENNWWVGGEGWSPGGSGLCSGIYSPVYLDPPPNGPAQIFIGDFISLPFEVVEATC